MRKKVTAIEARRRIKLWRTRVRPLLFNRGAAQRQLNKGIIAGDKKKKITFQQNDASSLQGFRFDGFGFYFLFAVFIPLHDKIIAAFAHHQGHVALLRQFEQGKE